METIRRNEFAPQAGTGEAKEQRLIELANQYRGDSRESQRIRLRAALRQFAVSTLQARKYLDILHPAGRVQELREEGENIVMYRATEETQPGCLHRVGVYLLVPKAKP